AEWQNQLLEGEETVEGVERWRAQWREQRLSERLALRLPGLDNRAETGPFAPVSLPVPLAPETLAGIARLAAAWDVPEAAVLLAAWQILLLRSTGEPEVLVGVVLDGRRLEDLHGTIGPLSRVLPVLV